MMIMHSCSLVAGRSIIGAQPQLVSADLVRLGWRAKTVTSMLSYLMFGVMIHDLAPVRTAPREEVRRAGWFWNKSRVWWDTMGTG